MIELPETFPAMPRWWAEGQEWLAELPAAVERQCNRWGLELDGAVSHGSNAIAVRVARAGKPLVLRMTPPGPDVAAQVEALRWWDGRGTVRLYAVDLPNGAMLLERLGSSLLARPVGEAMTVLGQLMRRLAVPAPPDVPSTASIAERRAKELRADWQRLGHPFEAALLDETLAIAPQLSKTISDLAVNGDFHSDQVLRGTREPWLVVDPLLYRGDLEYDLARILWTRDTAAYAVSAAHHRSRPSLPPAPTSPAGTVSLSYCSTPPGLHSLQLIPTGLAIAVPGTSSPLMPVATAATKSPCSQGYFCIEPRSRARCQGIRHRVGPTPDESHRRPWPTP